MEAYFGRNRSKQALYQYYYIKHRYYEARLKKEKQEHQTIDPLLLDSALLFVQKNIYLVENHLEELDERWIYGYVYYNMAGVLDKFRPEQTDSILIYLDKADSIFKTQEDFVRTIQLCAAKEFLSSVGVVRARALSRQGQWTKAHKIMTEALNLMDELNMEREKITRQNDAYQFMVDYYEKFNQPVLALKYQKLLRESEAKLYEKYKIEALNEMSIKYETEKKEIQIQTLAREKKADRRKFAWLTITLSAISVLIILLSRLKRKNIEQQLYETALLAELHQNELDKIKNSQLQSDKQQLNLYRVQNTIESIAQIVSDSIIEKDVKRTYLERLSKLDHKLFESFFQNAKVKISGMDMKYIICFAIDMDGKDISLIFNVEPASVNTVRYRIRKKCAKENISFL